MAQVIVGAAWDFTIPCERCISASAAYMLHSYVIATLIRTGRYCLALDGIALQFRI